jgi:hypothetical protein
VLGYTFGVRIRDTQYEQLDPRRQVEYRDPSDFDRMAFAMRALRRLPLQHMTVAVYSAISALRVESGRSQRSGGTEESWAMIGIPPHASREHIAYALAELAGVASVPYTVQLLLAADKNTSA